MKVNLIKSTYIIQDLIAEDLFSFSYHGVSISSKKPVLLMKYKKELMSSALVRRLIQSVEKLMSIKHDNIREVIDYYYDGKYFFIAYDYDDDYVPLEDVIAKQGKPSLTKLWSITAQVLKGLRYLEAHSMVHGNLNLRSILVNKEGQVKLTKVFIPIHILSERIHDFPVIEDCIFYAPELIQNKLFSTQSDVYAYGMILYVCYSNTWPYPYSPKVDMLRKALLKPGKPFNKAHQNIPDRLKMVVEICLKKDSKKRFKSFSELIKAYKGEDTPSIISNQKQCANEGVEQDLKESLDNVKKGHFKQTLKTAFVLACVSFLCFFGYNAYVNYLTEIPTVTIPSVANLSESEAITLFREKGLNLEYGGERFHQVIEQGRIITTKPQAGREVKANRAIRYFISKGNMQLLIPDLVGRSVAESESLISDYSERLVVVDQVYSEHYQKGLIVSQTPTPNTFLSPSENINVVISNGFPVVMDIKPTRSFSFKKVKI